MISWLKYIIFRHLYIYSNMNRLSLLFSLDSHFNFQWIPINALGFIVVISLRKHVRAIYFNISWL